MPERSNHFYRTTAERDATKVLQKKYRSSCGSLFLSLAALTVFMARKTFLSLDHEYIPLAAAPLSLTTQTFNETYIQAPNLRRSASSLSSKKSLRFPPLSCQQVFFENRDKKGPWYADPNDGSIHGRYTRTQPSFWISLHRRKYDKTRWSIMDSGVYYETIETQSLVDIIRADVQQRKPPHHTTLNTDSPPPLHVVDVGGNIGWYSLMSIATALEQHYPIVVDVFEPNPRNQPRLCESLFINEWLHHAQVALNLYPVGVTSNSIAMNETAVGRMDITRSGRGSLGAMNEVNRSITSTFPLVSLDQMAKELYWMKPGTTITLLKVDVEGFELDVFEGAQEFLSSHVVQNIFFEGNVQHELLHSDFRRMANILVRCGYAAYMVGGFRGADANVKATYDPSSTNRNTSSLDVYLDKLLNECGGLMKSGRFKRRQCNMWWRLA
jgi:FkbM family methyltransferase